MKPLYIVLAQTVDAALRCDRDSKSTWATRHRERINRLVSEHMPSGAGWDCGTRLDHARSTGERLVFIGSYHHMDENGYYDGWTEHTITARASMVWGIDVRVSGRDRNQVKDHLAEQFQHCLLSEVDETRP